MSNNILHHNVFPPEALAQAKSAAKLRLTSFISRRADLRGKTVITFCRDSGEYSDRAFTISRSGDSWRLGVHVADVSEFVCLGSPLDKEAQKRCASIESPEGFTPMLPPEFSGDVCSLREDCDRLTLSVFMDIDREGKLLSVNFEESLVRVARQCVFRETDELLTNGDSSATMFLREKYAQLMPAISEMFELAGVLNQKRITDGGLDYVFARRSYTREPSGKISGTELQWEHDSEAMVKELCFFASAAVGRYMHDNSLPCLYIGQDALSERTLGWMSRLTDVPNDNSISAARRTTIISDASKGTAFFNYISEAISVLLPCPRYSAEPVFNAYAASTTCVAFTRPLESYPSLLTQYILKDAIRASGRADNLNINRYRREVREFAKITSLSEMTSFDANRAACEEIAVAHMLDTGITNLSGVIVAVDSDNTLRVVLENGVYGVVRAGNRVSEIGEYEVTVDGRRLDLFRPLMFRVVNIVPVLGKSEFDI